MVQHEYRPLQARHHPLLVLQSHPSYYRQKVLLQQGLELHRTPTELVLVPHRTLR